MRTVFCAALVAVLLALAVRPCFAVMEIAPVSRERAKEVGMDLRFIGNGPKEVWVELEFKAEGKLKDFSHVSLEIRKADKLLVGYAPLREKRSPSGSVVVRFMANRACLERDTLSVVVGQPMDMTGYELRVKDFVQPERAR
ncbi:MAG: hypothetical protein AB9869_17975 [Verrucomicrobiia bacterium]